jgi:hypothetical protein
MCVHSVQIANTNILDQITCKGMFVYIMWTRIEMILRCGMSWHKGLSSMPTEAGGDAYNTNALENNNSFLI